MKKILPLVTTILLAGMVLHAQQKKHSKFFAELSGGPSFALGKFAGKTYNGFFDTDPSGKAKTGLAAQFSLGYYINKSVGVLLLPGYSVHKQDHTGYENYTKTTLSGSSPGSSIANLDVHTNKWKLTKLMAGGFFVTPLTESSTFSLITKITAGVCKTAIPGYKFTYTITSASSPSLPGYAMSEMSDIKLPWTFCYQVSVGVKYKLKDNLHVLFDINSFNSTPSKEWTFFLTPPISSGPPVTEKKTVKYKLVELNTLVGIGFDF